MLVSTTRTPHIGRASTRVSCKLALAAAPLLLIALASAVHAQSWTPLARRAPAAVDEMNLLTDGTVLVHHADFSANDNIWYRLTPDGSGNYANGTWTQVASMPNGYAPIDFASAVLADGKLIVEGGEYQAGAEAWTNKGALYDPVANKWTAINPPAGWTELGDAPSVVLANGKFMMGQSGSPSAAAALFNESTLSWSATGNGKFDANAEEGWILLPNGKVLTVDAYFGQYNAAGTNSEIYDPSSGSWSSAGSTIVQLWDSAAACGGSAQSSYEVGPMALRPDGTVFATGSNQCAAGHTAIYNSKTGVWTRGPDFPGSLSAFDSAAATEINGNVIVEASPGDFGNGAQFFEWNGTSLAQLPSPTDLSQESAYPGKLLDLPNGQILYTHYASDVYVFTPAGTYQTAWQPTITSAPTQLAPGSTYSISGTQFNGLTQGAWYGDDAATATNYPLVRLVNSATGHVFYCRTHDHSTMAVATGSQSVSTNFDVPANVETGASLLYVVANGIPSSALSVMVGSGGGGTVTLSPSSFNFGTVAVNGYSSWHAFTLSNTGTGAISIGNATATGPFSVSNACGSTLAANSNCTIWVLFAPVANGTFSGTLSVTDSASNSPQTAALSGTGGSGGTVTLSPAGLSFGNVAVGSASTAQQVVLKNNSSNSVTVSSVAVSGAFTQTNNCTSLAAGSSCSINVTFRPTTSGAASGTVTVTDNASNSPQTATLSGTGVTTLTLSPASYNFGAVAVNGYSSWHAFTVTNSGSASVALGSAQVNSNQFDVTSYCGSSLSAGSNCTIWVLFAPAARGSLSATLSVSNSIAGPLTSALSGTGQ